MLALELDLRQHDRPEMEGTYRGVKAAPRIDAGRADGVEDDRNAAMPRVELVTRRKRRRAETVERQPGERVGLDGNWSDLRHGCEKVGVVIWDGRSMQAGRTVKRVPVGIASRSVDISHRARGGREDTPLRSRGPDPC